MTIMNKAAVVLACTAAMGVGGTFSVPRCVAQAAQTQGAVTRPVGTVKAVSGNGLTLTTDSGTELNVVPAENARIMRTAPGERSLAGATQIQFADIQVGDRMLLRGSATEDGKSFVASSLVIMKKTDIAEKQARDLQDWQKRGIGGRVTTADVAAGMVTLSSGSMGASQAIKVRVSPTTVVRRYAPNSINFNDATQATLDQIKVGDQVRARGARSADGSEMTAEEIVAGTFRNVAGTVVSTDAANNNFIVKDLATKKPVLVKITSDSQLRKMPPAMAQMIAMGLKRGGANTRPASPNAAETKANQPNERAQKAEGGGSPNGGEMRAGQPRGESNGGRSNGPRGDINQMLSRLPAVKLGELLKGDAVMVLTTQGDGKEVTAITLLSGVEPILTASPNEGMMMLSPWSIGGGSEAGGAQ